MLKGRNKTKIPLHQRRASATPGRREWCEAARPGHYFADRGVQLLLLVLPDNAYLPRTQGSVYHSGLMTRGHGSVWSCSLESHREG